MLKSELINCLITQFPQLDAQKIRKHVKSLVQVLVLTLSLGTRIEIRGFASFSLRYNAPRSTFNPQTGQYSQVPDKYRIRFKPAKELRRRINQHRSLLKPN